MGRSFLLLLPRMFNKRDRIGGLSIPRADALGYDMSSLLDWLERVARPEDHLALLLGWWVLHLCLNVSMALVRFIQG